MERNSLLALLDITIRILNKYICIYNYETNFEKFYGSNIKLSLSLFIN